VPIDKVDHLILLQIVYWYEPGKQEHREGSSKLLTPAAIKKLNSRNEKNRMWLVSISIAHVNSTWIERKKNPGKQIDE